MQNLKSTIFALESAAHLQGKERELLPMIEAAKRELEFLLNPPEAFTELLTQYDSLEAIIRPELIPPALSALVVYIEANDEASADMLCAFIEGFAAARK